MRQGSNVRRPRGRGSRKPHTGLKQTYDSNGPDIRVRGSAYQVLEKYLAMARDANSAGDRIAAENYLQHAEHYFRLLNSAGEQVGPNGRHRGNGRPDGNGADLEESTDAPDSGSRAAAPSAGDDTTDSDSGGDESEEAAKGAA